MPLFKNSSHKGKWDDFLKHHDVRSYKKGEIILLQNEMPKNLHIIKSGVVRTYDIDSNGEEVTISFDNFR